MKCRLLVAISVIQVERQVSHHLALYATTIDASRMSLPDGCQLVQFLGESL